MTHAASISLFLLLAGFGKGSLEVDKAVEAGAPWKPTLLQAEVS